MSDEEIDFVTWTVGTVTALVAMWVTLQVGWVGGVCFGVLLAANAVANARRVWLTD